MTEHDVVPFNSALETGVRMLAVLEACYPRKHDLGRLVQYDYLTVHSADADGPPSLHPALPLRSGELLVRRSLVESGLRLMMSRGLVRCEYMAGGIVFSADDSTAMFLGSLVSPYARALKERAAWVAEAFDGITDEQLHVIIRRLFSAWSSEFQAAPTSAELRLTP